MISGEKTEQTPKIGSLKKEDQVLKKEKNTEKNPVFSNKNNISPSTDSKGSNSINNWRKSIEKLGPFNIRKLVYGEKWWETVIIPVRIFFHGKDNNPKYFDGRLNPYLFLLPFFAFINFRIHCKSTILV